MGFPRVSSNLIPIALPFLHNRFKTVTSTLLP
ncbi:unnamed protein product [Brugia timori]|uniref:Uncharacterized protein n=1 Tax=Brugia timori TaxID=42155 RepID=A0A3P7U2R5_9BILA|nr:unnamed protein product [Brugia timori]